MYKIVLELPRRHLIPKITQEIIKMDGKKIPHGEIIPISKSLMLKTPVSDDLLVFDSCQSFTVLHGGENSFQIDEIVFEVSPSSIMASKGLQKALFMLKNDCVTINPSQTTFETPELFQILEKANYLIALPVFHDMVIAKKRQHLETLIKDQLGYIADLNNQLSDANDWLTALQAKKDALDDSNTN